MKRLLFSISMILALTGCAPLHSYEASIQGPGGRYDIVGKRGALLEVVQPDGTRITADDKPVPGPPGAFSQALSAAVLGVTAD